MTKKQISALIKEAHELHQAIYVVECSSSRDIERLHRIEVQLYEAGYTRKEIITWVKGRDRK